MGSSNIDSLGMGHIVRGIINGSTGTDAVISSGNDGSVSLTATGGGVQTLTFDPVFNAAPAVFANVVDAAISTDAAQGVVITSSATNAVTFQTWEAVLTGGAATDIANATADLDFHFLVVGSRNR